MKDETKHTEIQAHVSMCHTVISHLRKPYAVTVVDHAAWTLEKEMFLVVTETDKN